MHPLFCSIQDAPCIQFYNIESAPLICPNIQGALSIEHTIYGHVLGHKGGGARAPSAPWLDPPLLTSTLSSAQLIKAHLTSSNLTSAHFTHSFTHSVSYGTRIV